MTDLFDNIYRYLGHRHPQWQNNPFAKIMRVVTRQVANVILPVYYRMTANSTAYRLASPINTGASPRLIVSLTSFPGRTPKLWLVIESLLHQTHKPDMIILWLSKDQFPKGINDLPASLTRLQQRGLKIEFREGDIRSHKKYYYTQVEYPDDIMVTVDDDIFYHSRLLEMLWDVHTKYPQAIATNHAHQMTFDSDGMLLPYIQWSFNSDESNDLFFIGAGANLFPPHSLYTDVTDIESARATCPAGDDIWLNAMAHLANTKVVHTAMRGFTGLPVQNADSSTLWSGNIGPNNGNDAQLAKLIPYCIKKYGTTPFVHSQD